MFRLITRYSFAAGGNMTKLFEMDASHLHTLLERVQTTYSPSLEEVDRLTYMTHNYWSGYC